MQDGPDGEQRREVRSGQRAPKLRADADVLLRQGGASLTPQLVAELQMRAGNAAIASALQAGDVAVQRKAGQPAGSTAISTINTTYTVKAGSLAQAAALFKKRDEMGKTTWKPVHRVVTHEGAVVSATVTVPIIVLMPRWPGVSKLSQAARAEWERAYAALEVHEQQHVDLAKEHLQDLHTKLIGKTEAEAGDIFREAFEELRKASEDYDAATDHGKTEGAELNGSIR
jgi:predicted secreted Zn-dependent protease